MESNVIRGDTVEDSSVQEVFCNDVEHDPTLLYAWNVELGPAVDKITTLDRHHLQWYRMTATANILCAHEHFQKHFLTTDYFGSILCFLVHFGAAAIKSAASAASPEGFWKP